MRRGFRPICLAVYALVSIAFAQIDPTTGTLTNDASQARLRVGHFVFRGPSVDFLLDGDIVMHTGMTESNINAGAVTAYLYLSPGSYSVAIVPHDKGIDEALIGPLDLQLEAGHRYTLAVMGQRSDANLTPLVIDETAALQASGTDPGLHTLTLVNNVAGTSLIDFDPDGGGPQDVAYGSFGTTSVANGDGSVCTAFRVMFDDTIIEENRGDGTCATKEPGMDFIVAFMGSFPGEWGSDFDVAQSGNTSSLNAREFLQGFSGIGYQQDEMVFSFDTFLAAMETTGLSDMLTTGGPYLMYVPTDAAFAALPQEQFAALMADPEALGNVLRHTMIPGYVPPYSLSKVAYRNNGIDRTVENVLGTGLKLMRVDGSSNFYIDGINVGSVQRYQVANGSFVRALPTLIMPPSP